MDAPGKGLRRHEKAVQKGWHPRLGAHVSIAGGFDRALEAAHGLGAGAAQIFTKSASQWRAKPLAADAVQAFRGALGVFGPIELAAHDSYLINLASSDRALWQRSLDALLDEMERCERLGVPRLVLHPGAHMGGGEESGLERIAAALARCLDQTRGCRVRLLIENTAGQGTTLGYRLEHLGFLLRSLGRPARLRVCIDTCHLFAAGYDFRTPERYEAVKDELERTVGRPAIDLFHLNDSKKPLGSRTDRHDNIGGGEIGAAAFGFFLRDPDFREVPMVVETPIENGGHARDLARLRRLSKVDAAGGSARPRRTVPGPRSRKGTSE